MASGVGGRTVAEAKQNMSYAEFVNWCQYRHQYGSLHVGMRVDRAIARHIAAYLNSISKSTKFKPDEFSPYDQAASRTNVDDVDQVFNVLKGIANGVPRNTDA